MKHFRRNGFGRWAFLPTVLMAFAACQTTAWKTESTSPFEAVGEMPSPARLTLNDGSMIELIAGRFEGDSIVGVTAGRPESVVRGQRLALSVGDVRQIERQVVYAATGASTGKKTLWLVSGVATVGMVIFLIEFQD